MRLPDEAGGQTTRYTTKTVLEAEGQVIRAADGLARDRSRTKSIRRRASRDPRTRQELDGIAANRSTPMRHATGAQGLALIDGQAGTGKSFTIAPFAKPMSAKAISVIGLAPTNAVAAGHARRRLRPRPRPFTASFSPSITAATSWNGRSVVIVDEAAMIDTKLMAQVTTHAHEAGAKLILVGDDRQLSSIDRGGMFGVLKDRHGAAELAAGAAAAQERRKPRRRD